MAILTMPQLGESVTEGTILRWLVAPGGAIALDDPIVEVETEKVTVEIPSPFAGTLTSVLVPEGETVPVGASLAEIDAIGQPALGAQAAPTAAPAVAPTREPAPAPVAAPSAPPPAPAPGATPSADQRPPDKPPPDKRRYSPAVTRLATEHGIDLASLSGSGARSRVTRKDVLAAVSSRAAQPTPAPGAAQAAGPVPSAPPRPPDTATNDHVVVLSPTRRRIAQHMLESKRNAPHAWILVECDASALVARRAADRDAFKTREGLDLTYLPYIARAVCRALRDFPDLNATWSRDGHLIQRGSVNLGVAVDAPEGLIVPSVKDADRLTVGGLARAVADLAQRARTRKLTLDEVQGGTFTLDNTGVFGTTATAPIINTPQVAILTMEAIIKRPVVVPSAAGGADAIAIRPMMNLCLSFDHRAMDGSIAGRFTTRVRDLLQALDDDSAAE